MNIEKTYYMYTNAIYREDTLKEKIYYLVYSIMYTEKEKDYTKA